MQNKTYDEYFPFELKEVIAEIQYGLLGNPSEFKELLSSFTSRNDRQLIGHDFKAYI